MSSYKENIYSIFVAVRADIQQTSRLTQNNNNHPIDLEQLRVDHQHRTFFFK